jgi:predicted nucleotidyltransferase
MNKRNVVDFDKILFNIREGNYKYIGSGSARRVFDLDNGYVVKLAKNKKGIAQNKTEYQIALEEDSKLFARILKVSDDFNLLIMEKAELVSNLSEVLKYFNVKDDKEFFRLDEINYITTKHNLMPKDLVRSVNWGMINNTPVIIDYGFTKIVRRKYYSPF